MFDQRDTMIFGIICLFIGFCLGYILVSNRLPVSNAPLGGVPTWGSVGDQTWDALK